MPTSKEEINARKRKAVEEELARLKRNRDRRIARAKQIQGNNPLAMGPPTPLGETPPSIGSPVPTAVAKVKGREVFVCTLRFGANCLAEMLGLRSGGTCEDQQ